MHFKLQAHLHTLHCITPTDEGGDEPYMWSFFIRADGVTLRQDPANPGQFIPSLTVFATPGAHGDLHIDDVVSGATFRIRDEVGRFETELRPIPFTFVLGAQQIQAWIPGRLLAFAALLDEDATSDAIVASIHHAVTEHIELRINQFFGGLNLAPVIAGAVSPGASLAQIVTNVRNAVNTFLAQQIRVFSAQLTSELTDLALEVALTEIVRSGNPVTMLFTALENFLDRDDMIGVGQFNFAEDAIILAGLNLNTSGAIRESRAGLDGAWYVLYSSANADLNFNVTDVVTTSQVGIITNRIPGSFNPPHATICVPEGTVEYSSAFVPQSYDILVTYPFCTYRYSIEGLPLNGSSGSVSFQAEATFQELDNTGFPFVKVRTETRTATINFQFQPDPLRPQLQHLIVTNTPADGTYYFTLRIEALLGSGRVIHVMDQVLLFQGQVIEFPPGFIRGIRKCLADFASRSSKSKRVGLKELWGPYGREQRYAEVQQLIDDHAAHVAVAPDRLKQIKLIVARVFGQ